MRRSAMTRRAAAWPYALAVLFALVALAETAARPDLENPTASPLVLLLMLAATLPVALVRTRPVAALALPVAALAFGVVQAVMPPIAGVAAVVVAAGSLVVRLARRARAHAVRRDVEDRALRESLLDHVARGERARIAHELHDVVAHHISMIAVQAEAARLTVPGMPPDGAKRLIGIGDTARAALTEMRRLLGVLREDAGAGDPLRPQPGLGQLTELLDEARGLAGASTRLIVRGRVGPLDPGVELTAYRIVQEALTNARRHATGAGVDVDLEYRDDALRVRVRDNGPGPSDAVPEGHGLAGMQERATAVGGTVTAGAGPVGGFVVEAVLPREGGAAS